MELIADKVWKSYRGRDILRGVSFAAHSGCVVGLLGLNGSGKTTLLSVLAGMEQPDRGKVTLLPNGSEQLQWSGTVSCLLGKPAFYPNLTGLENLRIFGHIRGVGGAQFMSQCGKMLEDFGLSEHATRKVKHYSDGMRQRLGLSRVLLREAPILLLDEPTNALDPDGYQKVRQVLVHQAKELNRLVILTSHRLGEVEESCDQIILLKDGVPTRNALTRELLQELHCEFILTTADESRAVSILAQAGCSAVSAQAQHVSFTCPRPRLPEMLQVLARAQVSVYEVRRQNSGLEALYQ